MSTLARVALLSLLGTVCAQTSAIAQARGAAAGPALQVDVTVPSTPQNVTWGDYPADKAPVARVRPGQVVRVHTITHAGATQNVEPIAFMAQDGIPREQILQDQIEEPVPVGAGVATTRVGIATRGSPEWPESPTLRSGPPAGRGPAPPESAPVAMA